MSDHDTVDLELVAMVSALFADHRAARDDTSDRAAVDPEFWATLESLGLARLTVSEEEGGSGASWHESAALLGAAATHAVAVPLAEHDLLAGWLLTEASMPTDTNLRTACIIDGIGFARAVPWAREAARIVVLYHDGESWRVADVPRADTKIVTGHNIAGEPRDDVTVDLDALSGAPVGPDAADTYVLRGALARTLQMCAAMEKTLELCVTHATQRVQFGRPIARFQAVQHLVADIAAETALARAATDAAVLEAAEGDWAGQRLGFAVAVAKSCAGHAASVVVRGAHQVHGAIGTTFEHELHEFTKPVLAWRSEFGSLHHWDELLAERAINAGPNGLWPLIATGGELPGTSQD